MSSLFFFRFSRLGCVVLAAGSFACSTSSGPAQPGDAGGDVHADASDAATADVFVLPPCPSTTPVATVPVDPYGGQPGFSIDATEVTEAAYCAFLAGKPDPSMQDPLCAWNTTFVPSCGGFDPVMHPNRPMACIDWCDAVAYCQSVGKHLCGPRGSNADAGSLDPFGVANGEAGVDDIVNLADYDEWFAACSHDADGQHTYATGTSMGTSTCNSPAAGNPGTVDVGSIATCVGGFPGIFDMSGNVWEWENACTGYDFDAGFFDAGPPPDQSPCRARGGAYDGTLNDLYCRLTGNDQALTYKRSEAHADLGFRCCSN